MAIVATRDEARFAKRTLVNRFGDDRSVTSIGVGLADDRVGHAVIVTVDDDAASRSIPAEIDGVPVRVLVSGKLSAL